MMVTLIVEMEVYAQQCAANLKLWEVRCAELEPTLDDSTAAATPTAAPTNSLLPAPPKPEDYSTAFPLTLPSAYHFPPEDHSPVTTATTKWIPRAHSPSGSSTSSADVSSSSSSVPGPGGGSTAAHLPLTPAYSPLSGPASPADSMNFFVLSPRSEGSGWQPPSSPVSHQGTARGGTGTGPVVSGATAALRAAYEVSVRKRKRFHRKSWTPSGGPRVTMLVSAMDAVVVSRPARLDTSCSPRCG
jgi:hypothetical protein